MKFLVVFLVKVFPGQWGVLLRRFCYAKFFGHKRFHIAENVTLGLIPGCLTGGENLLICPDTKIFATTGRIILGKNIFINFNCFLSADRSEIEIGDNTIIGTGVTIWGSKHRYQKKDLLILDQGYSCKKVSIGRDVWIGANVTILPGAVIGDGCVLAAGSVVTGTTVAPYTTVAGVPARKIGERV